MAELDSNDETFIQERLNCLHKIDCKVLSLLDNFSSVFEIYTHAKRSESDEETSKKEFIAKTKTIYKTVSDVAIDLRKEIKIMDENTGVYNKNRDGIMILPISVGQKDTKLGVKKLNSEIKKLESLSRANEVDNAAGGPLGSPMDVDDQGQQATATTPDTKDTNDTKQAKDSESEDIGLKDESEDE